MAPEAPALWLDGLHKAYAGRPVLAGLSLSLAPGEVLAVLGPSGCGKSTLLRLAAGREAPDSGTVRRSLPARSLPQEGALFPWLSALENVALGLRAAGRPAAAVPAEAAAWLARVGLQGAEGRFPHQLSGGMRQRAELARLLASGPGVLMLDEPFAALDGPTRKTMHALLLEVLAEHPRPVLLVTHDLAEALALADRVLLLAGPPARILTHRALPRGPRPRALHGPTMSKLAAELLARLHGGPASPSQALHGQAIAKPPGLRSGVTAPLNATGELGFQDRGAEGFPPAGQAPSGASPSLNGQASAQEAEPRASFNHAAAEASSAFTAAAESTHPSEAMAHPIESKSASPAVGPRDEGPPKAVPLPGMEALVAEDSPGDRQVEGPKSPPIQLNTAPHTTGPLLSPFGPGFGFADHSTDHKNRWGLKRWGLALGALSLAGAVGYGFDHFGGWTRLSHLGGGWFGQKAAGPKTIGVGHLPVTCHLTCPVTAVATRNSQRYRFDSLRFTEFASISEALRAKRLQATFMILPLAMKLREQGVPIKVCYLGHRDGSTLMVRRDDPATSVASLRGRTVAIPSRHSNQHLVLRALMKRAHLPAGAMRLVELPPPDMPAALAAKAIDAYFVGEPFAAKAELNRTGRVLAHAKDVWPRFISCVLVVHEQLIQDDPEAVRELVAGIAASGAWAESHRTQAADLAAPLYRQDPKLLRYVLTRPANRVSYVQLTPKASEFTTYRNMAIEAGLLKGTSPISELLDLRFLPPAGAKAWAGPKPPSPSPRS